MALEEQPKTTTIKGESMRITDRGLAPAEREEMVRLIREKYKGVYPESSFYLRYTADQEELKKYTSLPNAIAKEVVKGDPVAAAFLNKLIVWAKNFLSLPVFIDPFGDSEEEHDKRREWEKYTTKEFRKGEDGGAGETDGVTTADKMGYFFGSNKMGTNQFSIPDSYLEVLVNSFNARGVRHVMIHRLRKMYEEFHPKFANAGFFLNLNKEKKLEFISDVDRVAKDILDSFAEPAGNKTSL